MNFIDISWPIFEGMTQYKNRRQLSFIETKRMDVDGVQEHCINMGLHTGTHVDAPWHMVAGGKAIELFSLNQLNGSCVVIDMTHLDQRVITAEDLNDIVIEPQTIVLFKTRNSFLAPDALFDLNFVYVDHTAAQLLVEKQVKAVGLDYLGIERGPHSPLTHRTLLNHHIPIIEGLRLGNAKAGHYTLMCLPLALQKTEAAPARAVLIQ